MRKIRFATVGVGRMGRGHIAEMLHFPEMYELTAVCDNEPSSLASLPASYAKARQYSCLDALLKDADVELVSVATRHLQHVPMAIQILESGRYCVVEKPVACNVAKMEELQAVLEHHPGHLFLRHNRRFEPSFLKTRQLLDSGMLGTVHYINLKRNVGYCRRNDWMTMSDYYGGLLTNWGPHLIDQALQFLGSPVCDIWADVRRSISIGDSDDTFKVILKGKNGRVADIEVSGANAMPVREIEIICERGTIVYEGGNGKIRVRMLEPCQKLSDLRPHPETPPLQYGNFDETLSFVECAYDLPAGSCGDMWKHIYNDITGISPYPVTFAEGLEVVRVIQEVIKRSGFGPLQKYVQ